MTAQQATWIRWGLDALALVVLLGLGLVHWLGSAGQGDLPMWAAHTDLLLDGPDAGEWAINAMRMGRLDLDGIDPHRMPAWLVAVGLAEGFFPDIAQAGHFVNHLSFLLLPLVLYGIGRADAGPSTGLVAGLIGLGCAPLIEAAARFGVDPFVATVLPMTVLLAMPVRERFWLAPLAGVFAGYAALSHFTALPYILPAGLLILLRGPAPKWWHRLAGFGLYAVAALGTIWLADQLIDLIEPRDLVSSISEGMEKTEKVGPVASSSGDVMASLDVDGAAIAQSVQDGLMPVWIPAPVPWGLLLALPWIGAVGLGLGSGKGPGRWRFARWFDGSLGLTLVCCLAPLPVLEAAGAEPRYAANLLPFVILLVARGLTALPGVVELGLRERWAWFPRGVLALPLVIWVGAHAWANAETDRSRSQPLPQFGGGARGLGLMLAEHFEPGGGAVSPIREAAAYAGREYCPITACPFGKGEGWYLQCIQIIRDECAGEGPIPYVIVHDGPIGMGDSENVQAMGAWVVEKYGVVAEFESASYGATIVAIPRSTEALEVPPEPEPEGTP